MVKDRIKTAIKEISKKHETPFYLIDLDEVKCLFETFQKAWRQRFPNFRLAYSYKSNSLKAVTQQMLQLKSSAEVVSLCELEWALEDGFIPQNIFFDGPLKKSQDLRKALHYGVNIQLDSLEELKNLILISGSENRKTNISLRLSCNYQNSRKSRFGFNAFEIKKALDLIQKSGLNLSGLHIHLGSNLNDHKLFSDVLNEYAEIVKFVLTKESKNIWLDVGGGFPAKSINKEMKTTPLSFFIDTIKSVLIDLDIDINKIELITEPGRCLVEDCGFLVTSICSQKEREGRTLLTVDAGIHLVKSISSWYHPISIINVEPELNSSSNLNYTVYGSNCFEKDVFFSDFESNVNFKINDLVVIGSCGGYDIATAFAWTRPLPAVFGILDDKNCILRFSQNFNDVRAQQIDLKNVLSNNFIK